MCFSRLNPTNRFKSFHHSRQFFRIGLGEVGLLTKVILKVIKLVSLIITQLYIYLLINRMAWVRRDHNPIALAQRRT